MNSLKDWVSELTGILSVNLEKVFCFCFIKVAKSIRGGGCMLDESRKCLKIVRPYYALVFRFES